MKKYVLFLVVCILFISCDIRRQSKVEDDFATKFEKAKNDTTSVQAIDSFYNFGKVAEGGNVVHNFRFVNTGKKSLVIENAVASCGCTIAEKPAMPVLPGDTGFIKVIFNSTGKAGHNEKRITVTSNASPSFPRLILTGEVEEKTN